MILKTKTILIIVFGWLIYPQAYSQDYVVKVIDRKEIYNYYVYKSISLKDTLIFLSQKYNSQDFNKIKLKVNKTYKISTTPIYRIKISSDKYLLASLGGNIIDEIRISYKEDLPILVTDYSILRR